MCVCLCVMQAIMASRFPVPRYVVCDQHKSQARFLMHRLNPSITHNSSDGSGVAPVRVWARRFWGVGRCGVCCVRPVPCACCLLTPVVSVQ